MEFGELKGTVVDGNGLGIPFVRVLVFPKGDTSNQIVGGGDTDFDGNFRITYLKPGNYDIQLTDYSFDTLRISGIEIRMNEFTFLDSIEMNELEFTNCICPPPVYPNSIQHDLDPFGRSITIKSEDIRRH